MLLLVELFVALFIVIDIMEGDTSDDILFAHHLILTSYTFLEACMSKQYVEISYH